jgi:FMN phosphatase YigB (HAD superfamily)
MRQVLCLILIPLLASCMSSTNRQQRTQEKTVAALNAGTLLIEASQTTGELLYEAHQRVIVEVAAKTRPQPSREEVMSKLTLMRQKWAVVWQKFDELRWAHAEIVQMIDRDEVVEKVLERVAEVVQTHQVVAGMLKELREWYAKEKRNGVAESLPDDAG